MVIFKFNINILFFIIPICAMILGGVVCLGYLVGFAFSKREADAFDAIAIIGCGILTFILVYWFQYIGVIPREYREIISFGYFVKYILHIWNRLYLYTFTIMSRISKLA